MADARVCPVFYRPFSRLVKQQTVNCRGVRGGWAVLFQKSLIYQTRNRCERYCTTMTMGPLPYYDLGDLPSNSSKHTYTHIHAQAHTHSQTNTHTHCWKSSFKIHCTPCTYFWGLFGQYLLIYNTLATLTLKFWHMVVKLWITQFF